MSQPIITTRRSGRVAEIVIDNPPLNVLSAETLQTLADAIVAHEDRHDVRVVLVTTANTTPPFAADGQALLADLSRDAHLAMLRKGHDALTRIERCRKPVVIAIHDGMCMGGGLELVLACHVRVAGTRTVFAVPEAPAGAMPGWGNTQRLARLVGPTRGLELALTGAPIASEALLELGALNRVVPGDRVLPTARELAGAIARMRSRSLAGILAAFRAAHEPDSKAREIAEYMRIYDPEIFAAAVTALFEQRTIDFADESLLDDPPDAVTVHEDRWGTVLDRPATGITELRWFDSTAEMTADDFQRFLTIFAGALEQHSGRRVLIDATSFRMNPTRMSPAWRDAHIVPRYNAARVTRFAFHMPAGMPLIGKPPAPEGPAAFPTAYFATRTEALAWLAS